MCYIRLSEQTVTFALYIINRLAFIAEVESVYCAVRTESLYNTDTSRPLKVNVIVFTVVKSIKFSRTSTKIHTRPLPLSVQFYLHYVHALTAIIAVLPSLPLIPRCDHLKRFTPKSTVILSCSTGPHSTVGRLAAGRTTGVRLLGRVISRCYYVKSISGTNPVVGIGDLSGRGSSLIGYLHPFCGLKTRRSISPLHFASSSPCA
jgi:hypothetical protein